MRPTNEKESGFVPFREIQEPAEVLKFIGLIALIPVLLFWWYFLQHSLFLLLPILIFGPFYLLSFFRKIVTEVREDGVYVRVYPFDSPFKSFPFNNIQSCEVRTLNPIWANGRWGYYYGLKGGITYNLSAKRGVLFKFSNGGNIREIVIGSHIPEKLEDSINRGIHKQVFSLQKFGSVEIL